MNHWTLFKELNSEVYCVFQEAKRVMKPSFNKIELIKKYNFEETTPSYNLIQSIVSAGLWQCSDWPIELNPVSIFMGLNKKTQQGSVIWLNLVTLVVSTVKADVKLPVNIFL